jgi:hypothetical protein
LKNDLKLLIKQYKMELRSDGRYNLTKLGNELLSSIKKNESKKQNKNEEKEEVELGEFPSDYDYMKKIASISLKITNIMNEIKAMKQNNNKIKQMKRERGKLVKERKMLEQSLEWYYEACAEEAMDHWFELLERNHSGH